MATDCLTLPTVPEGQEASPPTTAPFIEVEALIAKYAKQNKIARVTNPLFNLFFTNKSAKSI